MTDVSRSYPFLDYCLIIIFAGQAERLAQSMGVKAEITTRMFSVDIALPTDANSPESARAFFDALDVPAVTGVECWQLLGG